MYFCILILGRTQQRNQVVIKAVAPGRGQLMESLSAATKFAWQKQDTNFMVPKIKHRKPAGLNGHSIEWVPQQQHFIYNYNLIVQKHVELNIFNYAR